MKRISEYNNITNIAENDVLPIVDVSDTEQATTGSTKKGTIEKIADYLKDRAETLTNKILTTARLNTPKINEDVEVTTTSTELNKLDGLAGAVVGTTDTQTLTNKTLTSPKINEDVVLTPTSTELNYVDGVTSAIQTQLNSKQGDIKFTLLASGKVTDTTNGVTISNIGNSGIYLIFTEGWVASTSGKAGFAICSNISGGYGYVDTIKSGAYSGTVSMPSATSINIKPYNGDGCQYCILKLSLW